MFIPLHDTNPLKRIHFQYVTVALIALNVAIYAMFESGWFIPLDEENAAAFAVIPAKLMSGGTDPGTMFASGAFMPERFTLISYMFLHGGWIHLLGNMLFLWVFGDNIEDAMGHVKYLAFYLVCAILAAFTYFAFAGPQGGWLIGASGAVAGVMGAYIVLYPHARVYVLFRIVIPIPLPIPALWILGVWVATQVFYLVIGDQSPVAWWAHLGGVVAGALLCIPLRRREVALFGGR